MHGLCACCKNSILCFRTSTDKKYDPEVVKDIEDAKNNAVDGDNTIKDDMTAAQLSLKQTFSNLPSNLRQIGTNVTYICSVISVLGDGLLIAGFAAFGPKYFEQQFSLSAGLAGALFGMASVSSIYNLK